MSGTPIFIISVLVIAGAFITDMGLVYIILTGDLKTIDPILLTILGGGVTQINNFAGSFVSYWVGTSKTSGEKDKIIAEMSTGTGPGAPLPTPPASPLPSTAPSPA